MGSPAPTADQRFEESKETPSSSCSNHRNEVCKGASHPRGKDRAIPSSRSLGYFIYQSMLHADSPTFSR